MATSDEPWLVTGAKGRLATKTFRIRMMNRAGMDARRVQLTVGSSKFPLPKIRLCVKISMISRPAAELAVEIERTKRPMMGLFCSFFPTSNTSGFFSFPSPSGQLL